jgi:hypothetical protein
MSSAGDRSDQVPIAFRVALQTVMRDPLWWRKLLLYGGLALTGIGLPIAAGFVLESLDNSRRGFRTPLPPWSDWITRWLTGLFALLIDFVYFVLPLLAALILLMCVSITILISGVQQPDLNWIVLSVLALLVGLQAAVLFGIGVAPVGRLIFTDEGRIEDALSLAPLRQALAAQQRDLYARARLASLPAYGPALFCFAVVVGIARIQFPGQIVIVVGLIWLGLSALVFAHLIVVQLYVAADQQIQQRLMGV